MPTEIDRLAAAAFEPLHRGGEGPEATAYRARLAAAFEPLQPNPPATNGEPHANGN